MPQATKTHAGIPALPAVQGGEAEFRARTLEALKELFRRSASASQPRGGAVSAVGGGQDGEDGRDGMGWFRMEIRADGHLWLIAPPWGENPLYIDYTAGVRYGHLIVAI